MQTILDILEEAGGWHPGLYLKIVNAPLMELVIEALDESGPRGLPALSVAHYGPWHGCSKCRPMNCSAWSRPRPQDGSSRSNSGFGRNSIR